MLTLWDVHSVAVLSVLSNLRFDHMILIVHVY
jgi:hypothetical protein